MRRLVLLAAALAAGVAAPASAAVKSPCVVVTAADVKSALGVATGPGKLLNAGVFESCTYHKGAAAVVVLDRALSRANFDRSSKANPGPVAHISGFGSDAYTVEGGKGLLLWKNGTSVSLLVTGAKSVLPAEQKIATAAAARL